MEYGSAHLIDRLEIDLDTEQEKKLNLWIDDKMNAIDIARSSFYHRHEKYLYNWDDFVTYNRTGPWENSSNLHMPLTAIMVKTYHARLYNIFSSQDTVQLTGREGTDDELATQLRKLREWYLWDYINGYKGIRGFAREVFYDTVTVGFGIGMKDWYTKMRKVVDVEPSELSREISDMAPQIAEKAKGRKVLETDEEMATKGVSAKPYKEVAKLLKHFEGSRVRAIPFEQCFFPNKIQESSDLDAPPMVLVETEMSTSDIMLKAKRGEWDQGKVNKIVDENSFNYSGKRSDRVRNLKERLSGYDDQIQMYDRSPRKIQYAFCTYDIDGDGIDEEIIVTRSEKGTIAKVIYLDRISKSGMRPLVKFDCFSKARQSYARGVPEFMYPLNEEMDSTHNMRMDYLALQTCPFGTYRASSSLKNQPIRIAPGKFIPTEETTDMKVLNFQTNAVSLGAEEDRLWNYADRLASVSSLSSGIVPQSVGPTRSTSGVMALLQQMDKEFRPTVDQIAQQWKKLEIMLLDDLDFRIDPGVKMKVLGASIEDFIKQDQEVDGQVGIINQVLSLSRQFDIIISVADIIKSDDVFRSETTTILQMINSPSMAQQLGIIGPKAMFKAYADWLKAYGMDPDDYLDMPEFVGKPMTFYQELQICYQEQMPQMAMKDDHMQKAAMLQQWMNEPEFMSAKQTGLASPNSDVWLLKAANKHIVLANMMEPKGMPNPQGNNNTDMTQILAVQAPQQQPNYKSQAAPAERSSNESRRSQGGRSQEANGNAGVEGGQ